jgi:hypothetical protein
MRRVLGDDHPHTLRSAHNLAATLRQMGAARAHTPARRDTLTPGRHIVGDEHPNTLRSARVSLESPPHRGSAPGSLPGASVGGLR